MVNNQKINAFIDYQYTPFRKGQCVKRLIIIWLLSAAFCLIGDCAAAWAIFLGVFNVLVSALYIALIVKYAQSKASRFLCDGFFYLYLAMILNFASYRIMTLQSGSNWLLLIFLLSLLLICIVIFLFVVFYHIKADQFNPENPANNRKAGPLPYLLGGCGILAANILFKGQSEQVGLMILSFALLILSLLLGIGSLQFLRLMLMIKQNRR